MDIKYLDDDLLKALEPIDNTTLEQEAEEAAKEKANSLKSKPFANIRAPSPPRTVKCPEDLDSISLS